MASKLERAALLLGAAGNPVLQAALIEKCRRDPIYWFNNFCWTYDPRPGRGKLLFNLYPFQEEFVLALVESIQTGRDTGIEKSRDMGATWLVLGVFLWFWLFHPDKNFRVGSKKQDDVDILGEISTLFEKVRFYLRTLPAWMLPNGYQEKKHATFMKLVNPVNGNTITGESANAGFSRSGRFTAVLFDEFAFWQFGDAAWAAAGDSTTCRIPLSTPYGKGNKHGRLMAGRDLRERIQYKLRLHWTQHPLKDQAWYEKEKKRRTADEVARELDISYEMSVSGIVFPEMNPILHVVRKPYEWEPLWRNVAAFDFGTTCAVLLCQLDDNDTLHVAKEIVLHKNGNTEDIAEAFNNYVAGLDLDQPWIITCDPAGKARAGKERDESTHITTLNAAGIWPDYEKISNLRDRLKEGIQLMKSLLSKRFQGFERIQIYEPGCPILLEAFQSEYKYKQDASLEQTDIIEQKHPWEDIMDCLRYILIQLFYGPAKPKRVPQAAKPNAPRNNYTGYKR